MMCKDILQPKIVLNNNVFYLEIADTQIKREKGLSGYEILEQNKGMLFIFEDEDYYSFWMKGTLIPLDIIWINRELKVVDFVSAFPPQNGDILKIYEPSDKALWVLEINEGLAKKCGIEIGSSVEFKNLPEKLRLNDEFISKFF